MEKNVYEVNERTSRSTMYLIKNLFSQHQYYIFSLLCNHFDVVTVGR